MRCLTTLTLLTLAAVSAIPSIAEAQTRRQRPGEPLSLTVRPRSFLDPGTVVSVGSLNKATSAFAQTQSYLVSPPYANQGTRFGEDVLADPVVGPFVGARNPFAGIGAP